MKNLDLYRLKQALEGLGSVENVSFAYAVVKNLKLLEKEIEVLEEVRKPSEEFMQEFQPKVDELVKKHAKKDEDGNPEQGDGPQGPTIQVDPKNKVKFEKEFAALEKENQALVDQRMEQLTKFNDLLQEEVEIELVKIKKEDLPEDIKVAELYGISDILEDL
jgi:hypothetical protein